MDAPPASPLPATSALPWQRAAAGAGLLAGSVPQPTIFARMSARAAQLGAMNLGQGFPDTDPPAAVADAAVRAIREGVNQYPPGPGAPALRAAIAEHQRRFYGLDVDPATEVLVTTGATEALASAILGLVRPGDEVLTLAPWYDAYGALIALAGGIHRTVAIRELGEEGGDGRARGVRLGVDLEELRCAFTDRTRLVIVNSPHNPTGIVLDPAVLSAIVEEATAHDALILTDEVYEHLVLEGAHVPVATLPRARERTITVSSAGKTFSVTGWKIGWACAPAPLIAAITGIKQWLTFTSGAPFQGAVAAGLALPDADYAEIREDLRARRDLLVAGLRGIGARVSVPDAGYFVLADLSPLGAQDAAELCERLPEEAGVVAIPVSAFLRPGEGDHLRSWVRFAFCKDRETLREAISRLEHWAQTQQG